MQTLLRLSFYMFVHMYRNVTEALQHIVPVQVNILDSRRSLNLNIFLRQFRSSHEDLLRSLARGEADKWGADKLRALIKFLPEEEEMKQIKEFDGDSSRLGCAERFCVELASISKLVNKAAALMTCS